MKPVCQFKVAEFRNCWWWFLFVRNDNGSELAIKTGHCRHENAALFRGLVAWAAYDLRRFLSRKPKGGLK